MEFWTEALRRTMEVEEHPSKRSRRWGLMFEWMWHFLFGEAAWSGEFEHLRGGGQLERIDRGYVGRWRG